MFIIMSPSTTVWIIDLFNSFWMTTERYAKLAQALAKQEILQRDETIAGLIFSKVLLRKNFKYH